MQNYILAKPNMNVWPSQGMILDHDTLQGTRDKQSQASWHPGSSFHQFDLSSAPDFFTADSLQYVSTQPTTVVIQYSRHAYEPHAYVPTYFAVTLSIYVHMCTLIPTVYRALLNSAVSGTDHRIHTTKKTITGILFDALCRV